MKSVLAEPLTIDAAGLAAFQEALGQGEHQFVAYDQKPQSLSDWRARLAGADQVILANSPLPEEALQEADRLRYLNVAFTGLDHIPLELARARGIMVSNAAGYSDQAVAEEVIGLAIALLRQFPQADQGLRQGGRSQGFLGREIAGKEVGIIGTGHIGLRVIQLFRAFGAEVLAYSRHERAEVKDLGAHYTDLDQLLAQSDLISIHLPLNDETRGFIGPEALSKMKASAFLINCARGPIVSEAALAQALRAGQIAGAGVDVFSQEPPLPEDHPLLSAPHTILLPHVGYFTQEAMQKRAALVLANAVRFVRGEAIENRVC